MLRRLEYYLQINGQVIDLKSLFGEDIQDLLNLCLFTCLFDTEMSLLSALRDLNLIEKIITPSEIHLVSKSKKYSEDYDAKVVEKDYLLSKGMVFLNEFNIRNFLEINKTNCEALSSLFLDYLNELESLIDIFKTKLDKIRQGLEVSDSKKVISIPMSLQDFIYRKSQIERILIILNLFQRDSYTFDKELELEYLEKIDWFVTRETNYLRRNKKTKNYRGLVKLAIKCANLQKMFEDLIKPCGPKKYSDKRYALLLRLKELLKIEEQRRRIKAMYLPKTTSEVDPDSFMFLEEEDYTLLYLDEQKFERTEVEEESVEDAIANLQEQKKKFGK